MFTTQVANVGYDAFSVAHDNMDKIRLETRMVPEYLQDALSTISEVLLFQRTPLRAHLHQASASTLRQLSDDACNSVLIENNGVTPEWDCEPIFKRFH